MLGTQCHRFEGVCIWGLLAIASILRRSKCVSSARSLVCKVLRKTGVNSDLAVLKVSKLFAGEVVQITRGTGDARHPWHRVVI